MLNICHQLNRKSEDVTSKESFDTVNPIERDQPTKTVKTKKRAKEFSKSEAELVDIMDTFQHAISITEKEIAKNLAFT